jgi:hypothetical protein
MKVGARRGHGRCGAWQTNPLKAQDFNSWIRDVVKVNYSLPALTPTDRYVRVPPTSEHPD